MGRVAMNVIRFTFLHNIALSIWLYGAWVPFAYDCFDSENRVIGWLSACNSVFELAGAAATGWWTDRMGHNKHRAVQASLMVGIVAMMVQVVGVTFRSLLVCLVAQCLFGAFMGMMLTSVEAWFADHVASGTRDRVYGFKYTLEMSGPIAGCGVSLALFLVEGDTWNSSTLSFVVLCGLVLHTVAMGILLRDVLLVAPHLPEVHDAVEAPHSSHDGDCEAVSHTMEVEAPSAPGNGDVEELWETRRRWPHVPIMMPNWMNLYRVPQLVVAHDLVVTVGSGFTTMYFSLFMIEVYHISPVNMAILQGLCGIVPAAFATALGSYSPKLGRSQLVFVMRVLGFTSLLYIVCCQGTPWAPFVAIFVVYAIRYGAMNATTGSVRSLLMDLVPASQRARWSAVESLQSASWSGTSVLGGYVADRFGFQAAFGVTCVFHLAGCLILLPAVTVDDRPPPPAAVRSERNQSSCVDGDGGDHVSATH